MPPKGPKGKQSVVATNSDLMRRRMTRIRAPLKGKKKGTLVSKDDDTTDVDGGTDADEWMQTKTLVKPDDQLDLTEAELKEEFTRILTANNPHAPENIVRFSFKECQYKQTSHVDQLAIHFSLDGNLLHRDSDEARRQMARAESGGETASQDAGTSEAEEGAEGEKEEGEEGEKGADAAASVGSLTGGGKGGEKKLTNQFNFSERASQTYNNPYRERGNATEPPPRATYSSNVSQWEIFDAYVEDMEKQSLEKEKEKKEKKAPATRKVTKKKLMVSENSGEDLTAIDVSSKIIERMVNQNTYDDIAQDYKYFEDGADEYRDQEGTLLPLWKFSYEKAKKLAVTTLCWNPKYHDLFAAGFGSYDFTKQGNGLILMFSMKNPSFPECAFPIDSGVMCLDLHPEHPYLVAAGLYDGSVAVFNIVEKRDGPVQRCTAKNGKHTDPVWQVRWQKDDLDNNLNFYSLSSDGRVVNWIIVKNDLTYLDIIQLTLDDVPVEGPEGTKIKSTGCGTSFDFHAKTDHIFLVGTEEGKVHTCSKAYSSQFIDTITAHHMAVYKVLWNHFHPNVFITCSADWTVKIWEQNTRYPLFTFDLNSSVGDVVWSPYSSTIFAAVTATGKAYLYDLNVNKYEALCEQVIPQKKKTKLTHISFNPKRPILIVGDDRGNITSVKLSPNLRKMPKDSDDESEEEDEKAATKPATKPSTKPNPTKDTKPIPQGSVDNAEKKLQPPPGAAAAPVEEKKGTVTTPEQKVAMEIAKLEKLLTMVREPNAEKAADTNNNEPKQ